MKIASNQWYIDISTTSEVAQIRIEDQYFKYLTGFKL
jgi:hypothetical protein